MGWIYELICEKSLKQSLAYLCQLSSYYFNYTTSDCALLILKMYNLFVFSSGEVAPHSTCCGWCSDGHLTSATLGFIFHTCHEMRIYIPSLSIYSIGFCEAQIRPQMWKHLTNSQVLHKCEFISWTLSTPSDKNPTQISKCQKKKKRFTGSCNWTWVAHSPNGNVKNQIFGSPDWGSL